MRTEIIMALAVTAAFMLPYNNVMASGAFFVKSGGYTLKDSETNIGPYRIEFEKKSDMVAGLGGEYRFDNGLAVGGELFTFRNQWSQTGLVSNEGDLDVLAGLVVVKKIFNFNHPVRPYIGGGIALLDGTLGSGSGGSGIGAHALLGVELNVHNFIIMLEGKSISGKMSDVDNEKINASGNGLLLGLGFEL